MESSSGDTTAAPPPAATAAVVLSPCAACKILRRRCVERCILAPYFPPTDPHKFAAAHRVFGASNIIKLLQDLPEEHRADAVSSLVYEAGARARDPVYGAAGAIWQLQRQLDALKAQLAQAQAHRAHLVAILCEIAAGGPPVVQVDPALLCAGAGGGGPALQASPMGWADEPLIWT